MKILVDTCIWSQVLRHKNPNKELETKLTDLIQDGRVCIIGPIRQELLSGITNSKQFNTLKKRLSAFPDIPMPNQFVHPRDTDFVEIFVCYHHHRTYGHRSCER